MKLKAILLAALLTTPTWYTHAASKSCKTLPGMFTCTRQTVSSVDGAYGMVRLQKMQVTGIVKATAGTIKIDRSKVEKIEATAGTLLIKDSTVNQTVKGTFGTLNMDFVRIIGTIKGTMGTLRVKHAELEKHIDVKASTVHLTDTNVGNITIDGSDELPSKLILEQSKVRGSVKFKNSGTICIDKTSAIAGSVENAKIMRGKC